MEHELQMECETCKDEILQLLSARVSDAPFLVLYASSAWHRDGVLAGRLKADWICLHRVALLFESPFKPHLYARILECDDRTRIEGVFRPSRVAYIIAAVWTAMLLALAISGILIDDPAMSRAVFIAGLVVVWAGGVAMFALARKLRSADVIWITNELTAVCRMPRSSGDSG